MKEYLISAFIDNEMDLDEKIEFVDTVHRENSFTRQTLALLGQEKSLKASMACPPVTIPSPILVEKKPWTRFFTPFFPPLAGFAAAVVLMVLLLPLRQPPMQPEIAATHVPQRFVVYDPQTSKAEIVGSFTNWTPVPMQPIGSSGYWSLSLPVSPGEHRYSYLLEGGKQIADPTVPEREKDDFGGENSIISI